MLDYEWENQSTFMFSTDQTTQQTTDQNNNQFLDPQVNFPHITNYHQHNQHHHEQQQQQQIQNPQFPQFQATPNNTNLINSVYDPRAYGVSYAQTHETSMLSLQTTSSAGGFMVVPKSEPQFGGGIHDFSSMSSWIGLNLGGRTYFASSSEDDFVNRLYRRTRAVDAGSVNSPKCQAEGCNADLTHAKHYHRRHKVCEFHSKAATVIAAGLTQRFCQQCSRFHVLSEFDNGKRSCRKRLADHNRRRRKNIQQENNKKQPQPSKSPGESGAPSSTVTVAISPPRISVDSFRQRTYHGQQAATTTSSPNFFSNG